MDLPVVHGSFVQPVIEELFVALAFKRERDQISLDRQTFPIADFLADLDVELHDFSQIRVIIVPDVASIVIIEYRHLPSSYFQNSFINHDNTVSGE
ncbi:MULTISPECIES: hypothetical protein [Bacteroidales]|jgi:hypothetical protein|uniref:hypothetical protein n=1 Tax=Bacteroidales TaxID=171549 RepID=UPI002E7965B7|nr:hypothetical protein [Phocaeicola dorei]